jgi:anaerobic selenocysteine-containing dehydrogenase
MKRRDFLMTTAAGATATVVLESCGHQEEELIPLLVSEDQFIPGAQYWVRSICRQCPAGCGVTVKTMPGEMEKIVDGQRVRVSVLQAKKIEGNPDHPVNRGKLCARGQAGLQVLYNPDRIKGPLKLTSKRGSEQYQPISWDEAIATLAARLKELQDRGEPHTLLFLTGHLHGHTQKVVKRFMEAYGSPNHVTYELFNHEAVRVANTWTMGYGGLTAYDLEHANYLLSFGATFLETFQSPVRYNLGFGHMRQGRPGQRGKVVQIEPRFSLTAANADEWIPVKPGTEAVLALGLAHVIIQEELYNKDFIARSATAFEEFKNHVLKEYNPERVSEQTEVLVEQIKRIAREFAKHQPSIALGGDAAAAHTHGPHAMSAVNVLNALVGSVGRPGGVYFDSPPPLDQLPPVKKAAAAEKEINQTRLGLSLTDLARASERVNAIMLCDSNPIFSAPEAMHWREVLARAPFVVSFSSFMDETTRLADLILPDHTYLESWWDDVPEPGVGIPTVGIAQPVVKPLYNTQATPDVLIQLAKQIGGSLAEAFPWENFTELLKSAYRGLFEAKRGSIVAEDFDTFWEQLLAKGGWWDADHQPTIGFKTPSGKFEFKLEGPGFVSRTTHHAPRTTHQEPEFAGDEKEYPFHLHLYQSLAFSDGRGANQPWLQEMPDPMTTVCWNSWVEINPRTAEKLGLGENDLVWIESPHGRIQAPVVLFPGARPDTVNMPVGQGHEAYGRFAQNRGVNPVKILAPLVSPQTGALAWAATRVKIYRAEGTGRLVKIGVDRRHSEAEEN